MGAALDLVQEFFDAFAKGDLDRADGLFDDDCAFVMPAGPMNKAEHKMMGLAFKGALPDSHMAIDHAVDNGDEVFIEGRFLGTHTGDLPGPDGSVLPASGNKLELRFADYFKVLGGRIVEHRTYFDQAAILGQLTTSS